MGTCIVAEAAASNIACARGGLHFGAATSEQNQKNVAFVILIQSGLIVSFGHTVSEWFAS